LTEGRQTVDVLRGVSLSVDRGEIVSLEARFDLEGAHRRV